MTDIQAAVASLRRIGGVYEYVAAAVEHANSVCERCGHEGVWHRSVIGCILEGCECSAE